MEINDKNMRLTSNLKIVLLLAITIGVVALVYYVNYERGKRTSLNSAHTQTPSSMPSALNLSATPSLTQTPSPISICPSTVTDIDGNTYKTVKIGPQCWMKENLKVTKNPEGRAIIRYCYDNDPKICNTDGGLYDWNTAMNNSTEEGSQGICPIGWHVPKDSEWYVLEKGLAINECLNEREDFTEGSCVLAGTKLKKGGTSGFEGILVGFFTKSYNEFSDKNERTGFWSSTEDGASAWTRYLDSSAGVGRWEGTKELNGFSVRCLED